MQPQTEPGLAPGLVAEPDRVVAAAKRLARTAGAPQPEQAVGGVLRVLAGRLPPAEHDQLLSHLPTDVRRLADGGRRRRWRRLPPVKTVDEFDAGVLGPA